VYKYGTKQNGYPLDLIFSKINLELKILFQRMKSATDVINIKDTSSNTKRKTLILPYIKPISEFVYVLKYSLKAIAYSCYRADALIN